MTAYIGLKNEIIGGTVSITSEAPGFERELAIDWNTYTQWKTNSSGISYYTVDFGVDTAINGWGFGFTNAVEGQLIIDVEWSSDNFIIDINGYDQVIPTTNDISTRLTATITARYFRFRISTLLIPVYFGHLWFGTLIPLPNSMKNGFISPKLGRNNTITNTKSQTGQHLGSSVVSNGHSFKIDQNAVSPAWIDQYWEDIADHLESPNRILFLWDQENKPLESIFAWSDGKIKNPSYNYRVYQRFSIPCSGLIK